MCGCGHTCVKVRVQCIGVGSFLLLLGSRDGNQVIKLEGKHLASPYSKVPEDCLVRNDGKLLLSSMQEAEAGEQ